MAYFSDGENRRGTSAQSQAKSRNEQVPPFIEIAIQDGPSIQEKTEVIVDEGYAQRP